MCIRDRNDIGGRRIEQEDIDHLLVSARDVIQPEGRMVLHAQPAHYTLDGAHGVGNPKGLHAERLGVDIHVMLADGAPVRNLTEAVQNAHLDVEAVVASPMAVSYTHLDVYKRQASRCTECAISTSCRCMSACWAPRTGRR